MNILNTVSVIKKMAMKEVEDFIFENYYKRIVFTKENSYYSMKRQKKRISYHLQLN